MQLLDPPCIHMVHCPLHAVNVAPPPVGSAAGLAVESRSSRRSSQRSSPAGVLQASPLASQALDFGAHCIRLTVHLHDAASRGGLTHAGARYLLVWYAVLRGHGMDKPLKGKGTQTRGYSESLLLSE